MGRNPWLEKARSNAKRVAAKPEVAGRVASRADLKANSYRERLGEAYEEVQAVIRLIRAWSTGRYRSVPIKTIVALLGALIYFLVPLDAIPDFILVLGFIDDIAIITGAISVFRDDLHRFKVWEKNQNGSSGQASIDSTQGEQ